MSYTRLIVKNLPNSTTETKLKELFSAKGTVTDVQLKRFDDGGFRHFAFVGFQTPEQADSAREYFDKTYYGASRMQVETCYPLNDSNKPKPWSKRTKEKLESEQRTQKKSKKQIDDQDGTKPKKKRTEEELLDKAKEDPDFLEFLEIHSKDKAKWGNDTVLDTLAELAAKKTSRNEVSAKKRNKKDEDSSDDSGDEVEAVKKKNVKSLENLEISEEKADNKKNKAIPEDNFFTVKLRNLPKKARKKDLKSFFSPQVPKSIRIPPNVRGFAYVGFLTEAEQKKALSKNRSMLLGNQVGVKKYISRAAVEKVVQDKVNRWESQTKELEKHEGVDESGRIFVRNLSYMATEEDLKSLFEQYGPVTEVHLPVDRLTRQSKGFAFISYLLPEHATKAFELLDGTTFQGRMLHLLPSKMKDEAPDGVEAGSSYRREKERMMKKTAGSSHNWNALFLGQNAVSAVVSEKYGVSREQLLLDNNDQKDNRISSVAVRMALAETEIVSDTKKFLEAQGVCLEAFEQSKSVKTERSTTAILVKNLVANTTEEELRCVFEKHGVLGRIVLPPSGISAIVEYMVPAEARSAFKKLAYSKFKSMPLYLEWAPTGVFRIASDGSKISVEVAKPVEEKIIKESGRQDKELKLPTYEEEEPFDENMVPESDTTLFVKNLNFSCTVEDMKKHFELIGRVFAATVATKKDPKNPGQMLSQGFGFVQYYRAKDTTKALATLNQSMLRNHLLELKLSSRTLQSENEVDTNSEERKGTKILVRNVPFQANEEEITDLFKVFGKLKAVRMPKKNIGESQHRGFAFIEFYTEVNAKAAFNTLSKSTHIYGRRLVLEWAQKDESVEELREKVAKRYNLQLAGAKSGDTSSTKKQMRRYFENQAPKAAESDEDE